MTITYNYFLLKGKYNEIRRNAQQRECMVIPNKRNTSINGIGELVFHYQVIGQNEHRNIEVPGREIDNGISKNEKGKKALTNERLFFEVVWLTGGTVTTQLI